MFPCRRTSFDAGSESRRLVIRGRIVGHRSVAVSVRFARRRPCREKDSCPKGLLNESQAAPD